MKYLVDLAAEEILEDSIKNLWRGNEIFRRLEAARLMLAILKAIETFATLLSPFSQGDVQRESFLRLFSFSFTFLLTFRFSPFSSFAKRE